MPRRYLDGMAITTWIRTLGCTGATANARRAIEARQADEDMVDAVTNRIATSSPALRRSRSRRAA